MVKPSAASTLRALNLNVIALVRGGDTIIEIDPDDVLRSDDILAVIGKGKYLAI